MDATKPIPMIVAWGPLQLFELADLSIIWGAEFELRGSSGFTAQHKAHGVCGVAANVELGADIRFAVKENAIVSVYGMTEEDSGPISQHSEAIHAGYQEIIRAALASNQSVD